MSDFLRKTLVGRLQASEKLLPRDKSPILGKLVPKLNLNQDRSCSAFKKEKLEPISTFILKRVEPATDRLFEQKAEKPEVILQKQVKTLKLQPLHFHGDTKFWNSKNEGMGAFIKKIKENQEFHDDFWYFNKGESPYDMILTDCNSKNKQDYYTVSVRGVSHFTHGEMQFINLEEWERENYIFRKIQKIPFFRKYRKWKTFNIWMKKRRFFMAEQRKVFLSKNLGFLDSNLQSCFLATREKCYFISKLDILDLSIDTTKSLDQFKANQREKLKTRKRDLQSANESIFTSTLSICSNSTEKFIQSNLTGTILDKSDNISVKVLPYTNEAIMRNHLQHIAKFIRTTDYMILESKLELSISCYLKLWNYIRISTREKINKSSKSVFFILSEFDGKKIYINPKVNEFKTAIFKAVRKAVESIFSFTAFVDLQDFSTYLKSLHDFGNDMVFDSIKPLHLLLMNEEVTQHQNLIEKRLNKYDSEIIEFCRSWKSFIKLYQENTNMEEDRFADIDIGTIENFIESRKKQIKDFQKLPDYAYIGVFKIDLEAIKSKILPSPSLSLSKFQKLLPYFVTEKAKVLLSSLNLMVHALFQVPNDIHEYISISQEIKKIEERLDETALKVMNFKEVIEIMEKFYIPISMELRDKSAEISKTYEKMRNRVNYIDMRHETEKAKFIKILRNETKKIEPRLEQVIKKLDNPIFVYKDSPPGKIVEILTPLKDELSSIQKESDDFLRYQDVLGLPRSNFDSVYLVRTNFKMLFSLWKAMSKWENQVKYWGDIQISQLDLREVKEDLSYFYKTAVKSKNLESQGNYLGDLLIEKTSKMQGLVKVAEELRNPYLKDRHWAEIQKLANFSFADYEKGVKISDCLKLEIEKYSESIQDISLKASKEEEIQSKFLAIQNPWNSAEFVLKLDRLKDFYVLQDPDQYSSMIQQTSLDLSEIMKNPYRNVINEELEQWKEKFTLFSNIFNNWLFCQTKYSVIEKALNHIDLTRIVLEKIKKFHHGFKDFTKTVHKNPSVFLLLSYEGVVSKFHSWVALMQSIEREIDEDEVKRSNLINL